MAVTISVLRTELLSSVFASTYSAAIVQGSDNGVADRVNSYASAAVSICSQQVSGPPVLSTLSHRRSAKERGSRAIVSPYMLIA